MIIDKTHFLVAVGALAAGGAGGYYTGDRGLLKQGAPTGVTEPQAAPAAPPTAPPAAPVVEATTASAPPAPICDDAIGAPGTCPAPGYPAEEGGCGALPTKRCEDFKRTMKPRVAERAVACLNSLGAGQQCDRTRLDLCAHEALMNACPEPEGASAASHPTDELSMRCAAITEGCGGALVAPTVRECRATLAGLSALGREQITSCMKAHCTDRGLLGCEGVVDAK